MKKNKPFGELFYRSLKKTLLTMRIAVILMILGILQARANDAYSQKTRLSLNFSETNLVKVLDKIEDESEFFFLYNEKLLDTDRKVNIIAKDQLINVILDNLFAGTNVKYTIINRKIILAPDYLTEVPQPQKKQITGAVTEKNGTPIPGVNVIVTGTTLGTVTDIAGKYSIEVPQESKSLTFSFIGMEPQEIIIGTLTQINVTMSQSAIGLEEVVVVGYGTQKKVNLTGAIATVGIDNLEQKTVTQLSSALEGSMPGVTITQTTGQPGLDGGAINIRGIGTLNNTNPLVLVDGVEYDINNVDANDIESISVLKDAAASSIYGVRAANGVILITTKRGNKGKTVVSYSGYYGVQDPTFLPKFEGAQGYMKLVNLTRTNSGAGAMFSDTDIAAYNDPNRNLDKYPDVNWMKEILKGSGTQQEHSLSVAGGFGKGIYRFSTNYFKQEGLTKKTDFNRLTIRLNTDIEVNKHLSVSADMFGKFSTRNEPQDGMWMQFGQAIVSNPMIPVKYTNGDWSVGRGDGNIVRLQNEGGNSRYEDNVLTGNFKVNYNIIEGLTLTGSINGNYTTDFNSAYTQALTYNLPAGGTITKEQNSISNEADKNWAMNYQGLLNYTKTIAVHSFTILVGVSKINNSTNFLRGYRTGGSLADLPQLNAGDPSTQTNTGSLGEYDLLSYFGRLNYAYNEKYLLEANIRRDGSSRFSKSNRFGTFPSFSAGWRISKEAFMKDLSFLKELKLRGSWGELGNQEVINLADGTVNNYAYQSLINLGYNYPFGGTLQSGSRMSVYPNSEISWETTKMTDVGLDGTVLNGQIDFSFDYYIKTTTAILLNNPIPETVGLGAPEQNAGSVQNKGWEFTIGYKGQVGNDFKYGARVNLSDVHNKILDMKGGDYLNQNNDNIIWAYYAGQPIASYYGYVSEGILRTDAQVTAHAKQFGNDVVIGDLGYKDLNGDNVIDSKDRTFIGSDIPRYTYGLNLNASYKGIDLTTFFQGVGKVDINTLQFNKAPTNADGNFKDFQTDNWTPSNTSASFPRLNTGSQNYVSSSFWIKSGAYLRLKNLQLGYTIPVKYSQKVGISRCRFYLAGQNLITWSALNKYGIDPENPTDNRYYPQVKTYTIGVNVEF